MITLLNMIFANPLAYLVFPNMVNTYNTGTTELARYTGHLAITDNNGNTYDFTGTSTIDFTPISGLVTIDNITDRGSVRLGRWLIPQSIIITNDITITVTPIAEVSSDGATITPQYEVKYNTYSNGELTESTVITPDNVVLQSNVEWITISNNQIVVAANTNTEARQGLVTIQVSYQEYNTSANYNVIQAGYSIEDGIMDAMVLWYDIKRQGATNESMAENPVLRDLSGNGHDATCYNFAWSGMSGIGGYPFDSTYWSFRNNITLIKETEYKWIVSSITSGPLPIIHTYNSGINIRPAYTIKISGMPEGVSAYLYEASSKILTNGINYIEEQQIDATEIAKHVGIGFNKVFSNQNVIIEFVPIYPNALVSDGVDDYCLVEGLPLLNKEDGYTVIAKRKWLTEDLTVEPLKDKCFLSDMPDNGDPFGGAYAVELNLSDGCNAQSCGSRTIVNMSEDDIIYQTSQSYCGQSINISPNFVEGNGLFKLFKFSTSYYSPIALNSILLFNRDLSTDEIEWVKTNLIETEQ